MQYEKYDLEEVKKNCLMTYVESITSKSKHAGKNQYICPLCGSGTGKDKTGAFTVYPESDSWYCFVCKRGGSVVDLYLDMNNMSHDDKDDFKRAVAELGQTFNLIPKFEPLASTVTRPARKHQAPAPIAASTVTRHLVAMPPVKPGKREHIYRNRDGNILAKKVITKKDDGSKGTCWYLYSNETGSCSCGLKGAKMPLYHTDKLHSSQGTVYFVEGEKDVETLEKYYGFTATSTPNGGGQTIWIDLYNTDLSGREIIVITDNDEAGEKYGHTVAANLHKIAKSVKIYK